LSAFGKAGPWSLSDGRLTFDFVFNVALCCFRFLLCFFWETRTAGERFRIRILHKIKQEKNDESEEHDLPKAWNDEMTKLLTFMGEEGAARA
jgi:hypothetical protein